MKVIGYAAAFAAILTSVPVSAQNNRLNQTVQVTNDYSADFSKASMNTYPLSVPDSIRHFDHKFDYQGFDKPYRGNEEFNPYLTDLQLAARPDESKTLYIKAGIGYTPAPVFRGAYTFKNKGNFRMGVRADHHSYFGPWFRHLCCDGFVLPEKDGSFSGYESFTSAGLDGRVDFDHGALLFNADYEGVHSKIGLPGTLQRSYNGVDASVSYTSLSTRKFDVNAKLRVSFGADGTSNQYIGKGEKWNEADIMETSYVADVFMRFHFPRGDAFELTLKGDFTNAFDPYGYPRQSRNPNYLDYFGGVVTAAPAYHFENERIYLSAGVGMMFAFGNEAGVDFRQSGGNRRLFDVFPTLKFRWKAIDGILDICAGSTLEGGLFGVRRKALEYAFAVEDVTTSIVKTFDANVGLEGRIANVVQYGLKGGWQRVDGAPLFYIDAAPTLYQPVAVLVHDNISDFYGTFSLGARYAGFSATAEVTGRAYLNKGNMTVVPSEWDAKLDCRYDFLSRFGIGAGFTWRSPYKTGNYSVDNIWDLRAEADYRIDSRWKVFLQGSNLLCADCQWIPSISRRGVCVTGGFVLNF